MIYIVNERTKEHRILKNGRDCDVGNVYPGSHSNDYWRVVKADADGWIEWHTRDGHPVQDSQLVDAKCSSQYWEDASGIEASAVGWSKLSTVTHYRPILEPQAEQVKELGVGDHVVFPTGRGVIRLAPDVNNVVIVEDYNDGYKRVALSACEPIRTDRERWIEAADKAVREADQPLSDYHAIYDAGLAKLPGENQGSPRDYHNARESEAMASAFEYSALICAQYSDEHDNPDRAKGARAVAEAMIGKADGLRSGTTNPKDMYNRPKFMHRGLQR